MLAVFAANFVSSSVQPLKMMTVDNADDVVNTITVEARKKKEITHRKTSTEANGQNGKYGNFSFRKVQNTGKATYNG